MHMNTTNTSSFRSLLARAGMLASAVVLGTLVVNQVLRVTSTHGIESTALAGLVSDVGGMTILTVEANSDELVFVIDSRSEELIVYKAENNQTIEMLQKYSVPEIFNQAKGRVVGP
jgi:hypothetical protein